MPPRPPLRRLSQLPSLSAGWRRLTPNSTNLPSRPAGWRRLTPLPPKRHFARYCRSLGALSCFSSPSEPEAASLAELLWLDELELRTDELEELRTDELASSGAFVEACALGAPSLVSLAELLCTDFSSDVCGGELLAGGAEDTATELTLPQASESDIVAAKTAHGLSNTALIEILL